MTAMEQMREMGLDPMAELRNLGYEMGDDGHLVSLDGGGGFVFQSREHYDQLADAVSDYVGMMLEEGSAALQPLWLPVGSEAGEGAPIYVSKDLEEAARLLFLIQGRGRIRAGVWACSPCINHGLDKGSMLPYIRKAVDAGYGVVVLNPNATTEAGGRVPGSETPERHLAYVWKNVVSARCRADVVVDVVAHSEGGRALVALLDSLGRCRPPQGLPSDERAVVEQLSSDSSHQSLLTGGAKVGRIVFADSYHTMRQVRRLPAPMQDLLADPHRTVNYVPHDGALGTPVEEWGSQDYWMKSEDKACVCLAAGVGDHSAAVNAALDAAFAFLIAGWHADAEHAELEARSISAPTPSALLEGPVLTPSRARWHFSRPKISLRKIHVPHLHMPHLRIPFFGRHRRSSESQDAVAGIRKGDRVEAEHHGEWYLATVMRLPPDEDGEPRWTVQCDMDELGMLTYTYDVRDAPH